jgi:dolichol-phosphate mannosyltransferase
VTDLSVVIPVFYNESSLETCQSDIRDAIEERFPELDVEFVFVDDGSGDGSREVLASLARSRPGVRVVALERNFGQPAASLAGFSVARGRFAARVSADLQEPASLIPDMMAVAEEGYEAVVGERAERDESWRRRVPSQLFYALVRWTGFPNMPPGGFDCMLLSRRLYREIAETARAPVFIQGMLLRLEPAPGRVRYARKARPHGSSRWTLQKRVNFFLDGLLGYTRFPRLLLGWAPGIALAASGAALLAVRHGQSLPEWFRWMLIVGSSVTLFVLLMLMILVVPAYIKRRRRSGQPLYRIASIEDGLS